VNISNRLVDMSSKFDIRAVGVDKLVGLASETYKTMKIMARQSLS